MNREITPIKTILTLLGIVLLGAAALAGLRSYSQLRLANAAEIKSSTSATVGINRPPTLAPDGMVWIPGGEFSMGSETSSDSLCSLPGLTRDAQPIHHVYVDGFWMDKTEVSNEEFEKFVKATGYITIAERAPTKEEFPTAPPENLVAGSVVFTPTDHSVSLNNHFQWWNYVKGANWRHPLGPDSDLNGKEKYPVVQIAYEDARLTQSGLANVCPRKRNGNSPRAAGLRRSFTRGATN